MTERVAIVLEDQASRVEWLRCALIGWRVDWHSALDRFAVATKQRAFEPSLVVLGGDVAGLGAADVVQHMPIMPCPVLVWSWHQVRAPQIVDELLDLGALARWAPFGTKDCAHSIAEVVAYWARRR